LSVGFSGIYHGLTEARAACQEGRMPKLVEMADAMLKDAS
jgi:hypothetical protein